MSAHNVYAELENGSADAASTAGVITERVGSLIAKVWSTTTPTDAVAGYIAGAEWVNINGATVSKVYRNIGTAASSNWNLVTIAAD